MIVSDIAAIAAPVVEDIDSSKRPIKRSRPGIGTGNGQIGVGAGNRKGNVKGRLVLISHGPGFCGICPRIGIKIPTRTTSIDIEFYRGVGAVHQADPNLAGRSIGRSRIGRPHFKVDGNGLANCQGSARERIVGVNASAETDPIVLVTIHLPYIAQSTCERRCRSRLLNHPHHYRPGHWFHRRKAHLSRQ